MLEGIGRRQADVRLGSTTDMPAPIFDVRFTLNSGHSLPQLECLLWANSGHCSGLIDYFIGAAERRKRDGEAGRLTGLEIGGIVS